MTSGLWFGAATTLAGAALAGAISLALSRQQLKDARSQRAEEDQRSRRQRSEERRFAAYADFATQARAYRDAIRALVGARPSRALADKLDGLAQSANTASALLFLITESNETYHACRAIILTIARIQTVLHSMGPAQPQISWADLNNDLAQLLRQFQVAVRDELAVDGIDRSVILDRTFEASGAQLSSPVTVNQKE